MKHLNRAQFRYIEHELHWYDHNKARLQMEREGILEAGGGMQYDAIRVQGGGPGNPTESKIMRLMSSRHIQQLERSIESIDMALDILGESHRHLFNLKYRMRMDMCQVCAEIPCSERTFYRLRGDLVQLVAVNMGLINP